MRDITSDEQPHEQHAVIKLNTSTTPFNLYFILV